LCETDLAQVCRVFNHLPRNVSAISDTASLSGASADSDALHCGMSARDC
jgi:hypothetical protein